MDDGDGGVVRSTSTEHTGRKLQAAHGLRLCLSAACPQMQSGLQAAANFCLLFQNNSQSSQEPAYGGARCAHANMKRTVNWRGMGD